MMVLLAPSLALAIGTWTPVAHTAPSSVGLMMLLSDGTVIAQNDGGTAWYRLTPDSSGHYTNGTWTTLHAMHDSRLYCGTQVLKDGRVFVAGGEYGTGRSTGEVYDPLTNKWKMAPPPGHVFSDSNSEILSDGRVLIALVESTLRNTLIFDPVANTWTTGPTTNGIHNESAWVKLPDDSLLFVDRLTTSSERYIPASNTWITDATVPVSLYDPYGDETGPGLLLPNGKVIYLGATGHTAIYTPSGSIAKGTWIAGPDFPSGHGMPDAPAVMLPNGKILCAVAPIPISGNVFQSPTTFYEYDYLTNSFTSVPTPTGGTLNHPSYYGTMLGLPDGTALYNDFNSQIYNYHPGGTPVAAGKPVISSVTANADGSYHLTGTQLNGISEGSCYGDDNQNATNYPIVSLTKGGSVYYARSYNWSRTSVVTGGTPVTTEFTLPAALPAGAYNVAVVANGIASDPLVMTFAPITVSLPASATEGDAPVTGTVTLPYPAATNTPVTLVSADPARATVPSSVTVLAGQASATFQLTIIDDAILNGDEAVAIAATATGLPAGQAVIVIIDNETSVLSITPSGGLTSAGFVGGPFSVTSVSCTLTNTGNMPLNWTMAKAASWLSLSATSGTLAGGANTTVVLSLAASANTLSANTWTDTIYVNNITTGDGNTSLPVSLTIQSGTPAMSVSPAAVVASGVVGGPFAVTSNALTVTNTGTGTMSWNVTKTASWLTISPASGTVAGGASTPLTVTINSNGNTLALGSYSDTLTFANTSNGSGNTTVPVSLLVQPLVMSFTLNTNPGWTTQGQWAYGPPTGGGGTINGNHDPAAGYTGANVYGVNLSGDYSTTVGGPYYLTAGPLNCTGDVRTKVGFRRWLNTDAQPQAYATLEVSNDGSNWTSVYSNGTSAVNDAGWAAVQYDISAVADNRSTVYLRWGYQIASGALAESGWNIDDVSVIATPGIRVPTAASQSVAAAFGTGTAITLTGTDTNTPAQALTFAIVTSPLHGALIGTVPNVTYNPTPGYNGPDGFTFTTTNSYGLTSTPATVTLTVPAGTPTADAIGISVSTNGTKPVTLSGTDPDLPPLALSFAVLTGPAHGTLSGTAPNLTYTATANYTGTDSFTYSSSNGSATSATATVSIVVGVVTVVEPVNPVTVAGGYAPRSTQLLGTDGLLYGTMQAGGSSGLGTVYKITTAGLMSTLVNFHGYDGATPQGGLCLGSDGNFYGTTTSGGANNLGTVFRMTPGGGLVTLVHCSTSTGTIPMAALLLASDGNLYGTTTGGGTSGNGTIFRMSLAGALAVLGNFSGTTGSFLGSNCQAAMIQGNDASTNLYGATGGGGATNLGTLFKLTTGGTFTTLVTFTGATGAALGSTPLGALVQAPDATLYGTTSTSGASNFGTFFKCATTGTLTTLRSFTGTTGLVPGSNCSAPLVIGSDGLLYGTTASGGASDFGTLFKITTTGTFTSIRAIASGSDPAPNPYGGLVLAGDGNFYATLSGTSFSTPAAHGSFFRLTPGTTNTCTSLVGFPVAPPIYQHLLKHSDGNFYGTTCQGGSLQAGSVFKLAPGDVFTTLASFTAPFNPSSLMAGSDGNLYGTCSFGGTGGFGGMFKCTTAGVLTVLVNLTGTSGVALGSNPLATLTEGSPGVFYGTTSGGATGGFGVVFKLTSAGVYTVLASFTGTSGVLPGSAPNTRLVFGGDGNLYGTTSAGGPGFGTLFKVNVTSGVVTSLASFTGTTGALPGATPATDLVMAPDGSFYGTTTTGGTSSSGTLYRLSAAGVASSLISFTGTSAGAPGSSPAATLLVGGDGSLYGTTSSGGTNGLGTIYRCTLAGAFTSLASFTTATGGLPGSQPNAVLYQATDGWFYGSCTLGGLYNIGTLFRFNSSGSAQTLYTFGSAADGGSPNQTGITSNSSGLQMVAGADGYLYGGNGSTVFRVHQQPAVQSFAVTSLTPASATLATMVVPNQDAATVYYEYGYTASYGTQSTILVLPVGGSAVAVNASLTGLVAGTVYHYRLVTITSQGTFISTDQTFATPGPPLAITGFFVGAGQNGITVDGVVNPYGSATSYYFEYGVTPPAGGDGGGSVEYLARSATVDIGGSEPGTDVGVGIAGVPVSTTFNLLGPGGTYYIRLVAINAYGTTYGDDQIINTLPVSVDVVQPVFQDQGTGTAPQAGLVRAANGEFYGTLSTGGTFGLGAAFNMSTTGTLTHLANFFGNANGGMAGSGPQSTVIQGLDGNYYGTTNTGGLNGSGAVFQLSPGGGMNTLVSFTGTAGAFMGSNPVCGLTRTTDGSLYGVTQNGGSTALGTVFKVTTAGDFTSLVSFTGTTGAALGSSPRAGLIFASDGNLYGTTATGGSGGGFGTIFKITPAGVLATLVNFTGMTGAAPGSIPLGALVQGSDNNFYGTTSLGGLNNLGTVFVMSPAGTLTTLVNFTGTSGTALGSSPKGSLVQAGDGSFYGTTQTGGAGGFGVLFKIAQGGVFTSLTSFTGSTGANLGSSPNGSLVLGLDGALYGTTSFGGLNDVGSIFRFTTDGQFSTLVNLTAAPQFGRLAQSAAGDLYGATAGGGTALGYGTLYSCTPANATQLLAPLVPTSGTTALNPRGGLLLAADGNFYGTTASGGTASLGAIMSLSQAGILNPFVSFSGTTGGTMGSSPQAQLITGSDGSLYGTTSGGGTLNSGTIFKVTLAGAFTSVINFTGTTGASLGSSPQAPLMTGSDGNYYGTTTAGGTGGGFGTMFRLTPAGVLTTLVNFTGGSSPALGTSPVGALAQPADGSFYGVTSSGGIFGAGTVFKVTQGGVFTSVASFTGSLGALPGSTPVGGLFVGADGCLYGVTSGGGLYGQGTLFRVAGNGTVASIYSFTGRNDGIAPSQGLFRAADGLLYGGTATALYKVVAPPVLLAAPATNVLATSATLNGTLIPETGAATAWFEYGQTTSYGMVTAAQPFNPAYTASQVTAALTGLDPFLTCHYRLTVNTSMGNFSGPDATFATPDATVFNSAADVPVTASTFNATGLPVNVALGFAPATGVILTLVNNTGSSPVMGTFSGLPEGSTITAMFGAQPFLLRISYIGGDGNDVTLTVVSQAITFPAIPAKLTSDVPFTLNATATSGLAVSYAVIAGSSSATLSGSQITLTGTAGTVTVQATQAGNGTYGAAAPVVRTFSVAAGSPFTQVAGSKGNDVFLGIRANGTLWGWGCGSNSQIGNGAAVDRPVPVQAGVATNWKAVSVGGSHAVAVRTDGTLWAWGTNTFGQVGDGSTTTRSSPVKIGVGTTWALAAAGTNHTVAVKTDGTLWSWGTNASGQLGQGTTDSGTHPTPVQVGVLTTWKFTGQSLSAGGDFTLALNSSGSLWAWGVNGNGQLGNGTTTDATAPVQIGAASNWTSVAAGQAFSAGLQSDGTLWAWGANSCGQLGDGTLVQNPVPTQVGAATNWQSLMAGSAFAMALQADGSLWSWGANLYGQLGQGFNDAAFRGNVPTQAGTATNWQFIAPSLNASLAVKSDGTPWSWGCNDNGELGYNERLPLPVAAQFGAVAMAAGGYAHSLAIKTDSTLWAWGSNASGQLGMGSSDSGPHVAPAQVLPGTQWTSVTANGSSSFAVKNDGTLWGWGYNSDGELGDGTATARNSPVPIGTAANWLTVAAGYYHTLALRTDGTLWAWGSNLYGQVGNGGTANQYVPVQVGTDADWASISGGLYHSVALKRNGTLWAWGENNDGQLGDGTTANHSLPERVGVATTWRTISAGFYHTVATQADGSLWAWGYNGFGQVGDASLTNRLSPVKIGTDTSWNTLVAGGYHTEGTKNDGSLWAWGSDSNNQLGDAGTASRSSPAQVGTSLGWSTPFKGAYQSLVITVDGTLWGFGYANAGAIGFAWRNQLVPDLVLPVLSPAQTISFSAPTQVAAGTAITLAATSSSGLPPSYIVSGPAILNGSQFTVTGPGTISVTAFQPGDSYWQASDISQQYINKTVPSATTLAATAVTTTTATINGIVNPRGLPTTARFQSGLTTGYGLNNSLSLFPANGSADQAVSAALTGLIPGTTYHFMVSATNTFGPASSTDVAFTTLAPGIAVFDGTLTGTALSDGVSTVAFGAILPAQSAVHTFTLQNTGSADLVLIMPIVVDGANAGDFVVDSSATTTTVSAGASITFTVTCTPSATGPRSAGLHIASNALGALSSFDVNLSGLGLIPQSLTFGTLAQQTCGTSLALASTASSGLPVSFAIIAGAGIASLDGGSASFTGAGTVTIQATQAGDATYAPATPVSQSFTVVKGDQVITFDAGVPATVSYSSTVVLAASSNFAVVPVVFSLVSGPGGVAGNILTFSAPGMVTVRATQAGNAAFNSGAVQMQITAFNNPPVASDGTAAGDENTILTGTATAMDAQGTTLTYARLSTTAHGALTFNSDGTFSYAPARYYHGADSFTFKANDGYADSNISTISLTVRHVNQAPVVLDRSVTGVQGNLLRGVVTGTDVEADALTFAQVAAPAHGSLTLNADGSYQYRPDAAFVGTDSFIYKANDGQADSNIATVTLVIITTVPQWTWMGGTGTANQKGSYCTLGIPAAANSPGARQSAATWSDGLGHFWMFGGTGYGAPTGNAATTGPGALNDLWTYDVATSLWTWLAGGNGINAGGTYGTQGTAATTNIPGARMGGATWRDQPGNLWLFGGNGRDSSATGTGFLNDLWMYNTASSSWTWMGGSNLKAAAVASGGSTPEARSGAATWVDSAGRLMLFGGRALPASATVPRLLNDLWRYDTGTYVWTLLRSGNAGQGIYGVKGAGNTATQPGARADAVSWMDTQGRMWLFGGSGFATTAISGNLNDLWCYDATANRWTWINGASTISAPGVYGTLGTTDPACHPGARSAATGWTDATGAFWLFGGTGSASSTSGLLNDVWCYQPAANTWTWMKGPGTPGFASAYGTQGVANSANTPGARQRSLAFTDANGHLWLLGGINAANCYSDFWRLTMPPVPVALTQWAGNAPPAYDFDASVNANGLPTTGSFRYSIHPDFADAIATPGEELGSTISAVGLHPTVTGLLPGTAYYVQALAVNSFGQGTGRTFSFTTPGTAPAPVASFTSSGSIVSESAGTVTVAVQLSAPGTTAFTIPFTLGGTATATDYTAPISTLTFVPGQTLATVDVKILDDVVHEVDKTVVITLGTPTGGVTLGSVSVYTLTITDNDVAPQVITPASVFAMVGSSTVFSPAVTGTAPLTYQWKKNNAAISGATSATYTIASTALTSIGNYTLQATNPTNSITSVAAELSVIDVSDHAFVLAPNATATLTVNASSPGPLTYQWRKNGVTMVDAPTRVTGSTTKTLTIKLVGPADDDDYTCTVTCTDSGLIATSGHNKLAVVSLKPAILTAGALTTGVVGGQYTCQIVVDSDPSKTPASFTVTGLPAGLTVNARGLISGRPTAAVNSKAVTITATNSSGPSPVQPCTLTILPLPVTVPGSFVASVARQPGVADNLGARVDITPTSAGSFTAKLTLNGLTVSSTGLLTTTLDISGASPVITAITGHVLFPRTGKSALVLDFALDAPPNTLTGTLTDAVSSASAAVTGLRNPWNAITAKATSYKGYYTFGLVIDPGSLGDQSIPQGNGFGSFTVADDGTLAFAGRTADNTAFSTATFAGPAGQVIVFVPSATNPGSLTGTPVIVPDAVNNHLAGTVSWNKGAAAATSTDHAYRSGFAPLDLTLLGGKYTAPVAGGVVMGLPNSYLNVRLSFFEGGIMTSQAPPVVFSIRNNSATGITQTLTVPVAGGVANPAKMSFALAASPLGQFGGNFTIADAPTALVRTTTYQGMIIRLGGSYQALGCFLMPQLPEPGQTLGTSPQLSGRVVLEGVPP